jgi:hypothetical protein
MTDRQHRAGRDVLARLAADTTGETADRGKLMSELDELVTLVYAALIRKEPDELSGMGALVMLAAIVLVVLFVWTHPWLFVR